MTYVEKAVKAFEALRDAARTDAAREHFQREIDWLKRSRIPAGGTVESLGQGRWRSA